MGYPVAYRGRSRPSNRPFPSGPGGPTDPTFPLLGGAVATMTWAFGTLADQVGGGYSTPGATEDPGVLMVPVKQWNQYGDWTAVWVCQGGGTPRQGGWTSCGLKILSKAAYENTTVGGSQQTVYTWGDGNYNPVLLRYENVETRTKWFRSFGSWNFPRYRPYPAELKAGTALPRVAGVIPRPARAGYLPAELPETVGLGGVRSTPGYWRTVVDVSDPDRPAPPIPRPIPITPVVTVTAPYKEIKIRGGSKAALAFMAMFRTFVFWNDMNGIINAIWRAIPAQYRRGGSRTAAGKLRTIWANVEHVDLGAMAVNVGMFGGARWVAGHYFGTASNVFRNTLGDMTGTLHFRALTTIMGSARWGEVTLQRVRQMEAGSVRWSNPSNGEGGG